MRNAIILFVSFIAVLSACSRITPEKKYVFYFHDHFVEEKGINAIDEKYGRFEYYAILDTLKKAGFTVISEVRTKETNLGLLTERIATRIDSFIKSGVKPQNITVIGASKGGGIAIIISSILQSPNVNYVILAICDQHDFYNTHIDNKFFMCGNFLNIYEKSDTIAGDCGKFFKMAKCLTHKKEIELNMGNGHGFIFKPYREWTAPAIKWANGRYDE